MGRASVGALLGAALLTGLVPAARAQGGSALPPLPGQNAPAGGAPADAAPARSSAAPAGARAPAAGSGVDLRKLYERLRRGVVAVERNGVPAAVGTVLGGDGRVLTSLSALGGADSVDVRYADGTAVVATVGEADTDLDLALLVPKSTKWTDGLGASESDPTGALLQAMLPSLAKGGTFLPSAAGVKGLAEAHAKDGQALLDLLDVDLKGTPIVGAPLLDATGNVVAVLVRACKGPAEGGAGASSEGCVPVVLGAPVAAVRSFLSRATVAASAAAPAGAAAPPAPAPWLGIRGQPETGSTGSVRGVRVTAVAPSSPAEKAGLKPASDVIVAVDGQPVTTPEKLAAAIGKHAPGDSVKILVFGGDGFHEVAVALKTAP